MKTIHSPGVIPTFEIGFSSPLADISNLDTWRGIPGAVGPPNRYTFIDETTPDDSDYISQGLGNAASIYSCDCGPPTLGAGSIVASYRVRRMGGTGVWNAFLRLARGGVPVHVETVAPINPNLSTDFTTIAVALSAGEIATLYGAAGNMQMTMDCGGGPGTDALECSWLRVSYLA